MTDNSIDLYNLVVSKSAITSAVETYNSNPAIWCDTVIPEGFVGKKSINFYLNTPADMTAPINNFTYIFNCRDEDYPGSLTIAETVITELNRYALNGVGVKCTLMPTLPPANETDNYNTPVLVNFIN